MSEPSAIENLVLHAITDQESRADTRTDLTSIWDHKVMRNLGSGRPNRHTVSLAIQRLRRRGVLTSVGTGAGMRYHLSIVERVSRGMLPNPYDTPEARRHAKQREEAQKRGTADREWWRGLTLGQRSQVVFDAMLTALPKLWLTSDQIVEQLARLREVPALGIHENQVQTVIYELMTRRMVHGTAAYTIPPRILEMYIHRAVSHRCPTLPQGDWLTLSIATDRQVASGEPSWRFRATLGTAGEPLQEMFEAGSIMAAASDRYQYLASDSDSNGLLSAIAQSISDQLLVIVPRLLKDQAIHWCVTVYRGNQMGTWDSWDRKQPQ